MAERNLRSSEARFSGILHLAKDAIISVDDSQHIMLFNHAAEQIFGYTAEEMIGQPLDLLIPHCLLSGGSSDVGEFRLNQISPTSMTSRNEVIRSPEGWREVSSRSELRTNHRGRPDLVHHYPQGRFVAQAGGEILRAAKTHAEQAADAKRVLLAAVEAFFVRLTESNIVCEWTNFAEKLFDIPLTEAMGKAFQDLPIAWSWEAVTEAINRATRSQLGSS